MELSIYSKFREIFKDYHQDTSTEICMVPAFDAAELADTLLFEIAIEVEF